jgi:hypothetical protein
MTFISADKARKRIAEFKRFDPSKIQDKLKSIADTNISYVLNDLKDAFLYNPLLKQYFNNKIQAIYSFWHRERWI